MTNFDKLVKQIKKASNVFITGHKNLDLDALGSCAAVYNLCEKSRKKSYIIIDDTKHESSIKKALKYIDENLKYNILKYNESKELINNDSLLIIVDTYSEKRIQNPKILKHITNCIIVDHHLFGKPINSKYFIDSSASSCCEMFAEYYKKKGYRINKNIANLLYGGIIIDTNNFSMKTTAVTHEISAYLLKCGAKPLVVNEFIRGDIEDYIKIQKEIFNAEFYMKKYPIVKCNRNKQYDIDELAKISDALLMFNDVEASFTIGKINDTIIGVSARSLNSDAVDISKIMNKLGGGGSKTNAAAQLTDKSINEIVSYIKGELK